MVRVGEKGFLFYQIFPDPGIGIPSNGASWITVCSTDVPYVVPPSVFVQVVIINGSLILRLGFVMLVRLFDLSSGTIWERLCLEFKELSRT